MCGKNISLPFMLILVVGLLSQCQNRNTANSDWEPLFNGSDLTNWSFYLSRPDKSIDIPDLAKDSLGNYTEPLRDNDPLNVFSVDTLQGQPVIRISGAVVGNLYTLKKYKNYHLKLKFRWGNKKWDWMKGRPKDGGVLYHYNTRKGQAGVRHEFQIHAGDVGSYWAKHTIVDIPAQLTSDIPNAIRKAKPYLLPLVPNLGDTMLIFDRNSAMHHFDGTNEWQICLTNPLVEQNESEWNTLELLCYENHVVHKVNDIVNMMLVNAKYMDNDQLMIMDSGSIQLQSEGAEIFFKDIMIKPLTEMPPLLEPFLSN